MAGGIVTDGRGDGTASRSCRSTASTTPSISACTGARAATCRRLILTASGGPFRGRSASDLTGVSAADALQAPDLADGPEDHHRLGDADEQGARGHRGALAVRRRRGSQIDVVVHPQSVVHSMVELTDGSIIAQLGVTDMRLPIQYAFSYPERWTAPLPPLDLTRAGRLEFETPDTETFPCLRLAYRALEAGAQPPGRAERGQRDRGGAVSRRPARVHGDRRRHRAHDGRASPGRRRAPWLRSARSIAGRANMPGRSPAG